MDCHTKWLFFQLVGGLFALEHRWSNENLDLFHVICYFLLRSTTVNHYLTTIRGVCFIFPSIEHANPKKISLPPTTLMDVKEKFLFHISPFLHKSTIGERVFEIKLCVVVSKIVYFHPYLGKCSNLTSISWHRLVQPPTIEKMTIHLHGKKCWMCPSSTSGICQGYEGYRLGSLGPENRKCHPPVVMLVSGATTKILCSLHVAFGDLKMCRIWINLDVWCTFFKKG